MSKKTTHKEHAGKKVQSSSTLDATKPTVKEEGKKTPDVKPSALEAVVDSEKPEQTKTSKTNNDGGRDFSKFSVSIQGGPKLENLSKGRLALAIVRLYITKNKGATMSKLKEIFPDTLVKPYAMIKELPAAKRISAKSGRDRYFMKPEEVITIKGKKVVVTNQIGKKELDLILPISKKLGMVVK